jgi:porin
MTVSGVLVMLLMLAGVSSAGAQCASPGPSPSPAPVTSPTPSSAFTPILTYTGEAAANPAGGIRQGTAYADQLLAGFDLDLGRLIDVPGGTLHVDVTHRAGNNLATDDIGNNTSIQEIYGGQGWHLATFSYEQLLFRGRLDIEAGRIPANVSFVHSTLYCVFQSNSACANPPFVFTNSNFTYYPVGGWGVHAKAFLTDHIFLHVGAYASNTDPANAGFNFDMSHTTGVIVPAEAGYSTTYANDTHPRNYIIGGWYDDSIYANPSGSMQRGRSAVYGRFDQVIWRPSLASKRNLTLFGVAMSNLSGNVVESDYDEVGFVQTGTFVGRDHDTLGFVINDQHFTNNQTAVIRAARAAAGGTEAVPTRETMMELAYGVQLSKAIVISPNLQYIVNPDQINEPTRTQNIKNACVLGLHVAVDLVSLLSPHR